MWTVHIECEVLRCRAFCVAVWPELPPLCCALTGCPRRTEHPEQVNGVHEGLRSRTPSACVYALSLKGCMMHCGVIDRPCVSEGPTACACSWGNQPHQLRGPGGSRLQSGHEAGLAQDQGLQGQGARPKPYHNPQQHLREGPPRIGLCVSVYRCR